MRFEEYADYVKVSGSHWWPFGRQFGLLTPITTRAGDTFKPGFRWNGGNWVIMRPHDPMARAFFEHDADDIERRRMVPSDVRLIRDWIAVWGHAMTWGYGLWSPFEAVRAMLYVPAFLYLYPPRAMYRGSGLGPAAVAAGVWVGMTAILPWIL